MRPLDSYIVRKLGHKVMNGKILKISYIINRKVMHTRANGIQKWQQATFRKDQRKRDTTVKC